MSPPTLRTIHTTVNMPSPHPTREDLLDDSGRLVLAWPFISNVGVDQSGTITFTIGKESTLLHAPLSSFPLVVTAVQIAVRDWRTDPTLAKLAEQLSLCQFHEQANELVRAAIPRGQTYIGTDEFFVRDCIPQTQSVLKALQRPGFEDIGSLYAPYERAGMWRHMALSMAASLIFAMLVLAILAFGQVPMVASWWGMLSIVVIIATFGGFVCHVWEHILEYRHFHQRMG